MTFSIILIGFPLLWNLKQRNMAHFPIQASPVLLACQVH